LEIPNPQVVVLRKLEHPHIVRLMGVCPESCGLVYEHLPNGTLVDKLCKGLLWKDHVTILAEQRSALAYLHSWRPAARHHPRGPALPAAGGGRSSRQRTTWIQTARGKNEDTELFF
jgi:hypothetical protein